MAEETEEERIQRQQREVKENLKHMIDSMTIDSFDLGELDWATTVITIRGRLEN